MTDTTTNTTQVDTAQPPAVDTPAPAESKKKMIVGDLTPLVPAFFDSIQDASAAIQSYATTYADWNEHAGKLIVAGMDADGQIDAAAYPDGTRVMFHVITNRGAPILDAAGKKTGTSPATVKGMIVWPVPTHEAMLADEAGLKWAKDKLNTQIAHVTVAKLRDSDNIAAAAKQMPGIVEVDGVPTYDMASFFAIRESGAISGTYDALYKDLLDAFKEKSKLWAKFRLNKSELRKALESKPYALAIYGPLEDRGDKPSLFVVALNIMIESAKAQGHDPAILNTWLETRDSATATDQPEDADDDDDIDSALEGLILTKPAEPAPTVETTA